MDRQTYIKTNAQADKKHRETHKLTDIQTDGHRQSKEPLPVVCLQTNLYDLLVLRKTLFYGLQ